MEEPSFQKKQPTALLKISLKNRKIVVLVEQLKASSA
jgi:hypothetical protein